MLGLPMHLPDTWRNADSLIQTFTQDGKKNKQKTTPDKEREDDAFIPAASEAHLQSVPAADGARFHRVPAVSGQ